METNDKPKKRAPWVIPLVVVVFCVAIAILIFFWLNGNKTYTSTGDTNEAVSYLSCSANTVSDPFFQPPNLISAEHQIKITFDSNKAKNTNYMFKGTFPSEDWAKQARASMNAQYNIYMGDHMVSADTLTPNFEYVGEIARISLYADKTEINQVTAPLFFLSSEEAANFYTYTSNRLTDLYTKKGFSCVLTK